MREIKHNQLNLPQLTKIPNVGDMAMISPNRGSLSTIIRSYKSAITKHANRLHLPFKWQPRFHEHVIRDEDDYNRITSYILTNVENWKDDRFMKE